MSTVASNPSPAKPGLRGIFTRDFALVALVNFAVFTAFQMVNVGMPVYLAQLGASELAVGLATTLVTMAALAVRPVSGILLDRFGRKGFLLGGIVVMGCAVVSYAVFPLVGLILALRLLQGLGWGFCSTASSTIAADVVPKRRFAEGMGYFGMTAALAGAFAPALAIELVQGPGATWLVGAATACLAVALVLGLFLNAPAPARSAGAQGRPGFSAADFFERSALFPALVMMLVNMGFGSINTFIVLHGEAQGVDGMSIYFLVYAAVNVVTRPYMGRLIDNRGYLVPGVLSTLCMAASMALLGAADSLGLFCAAGALVGLGGGTAMGTFQAMAVAKAAPERRGVATSTYMLFFDAGIGVGAAVAGVLSGVAGYGAMYLCMGAFPALGCLAFVLAGKKRLEAYRR